MSRLWAAFDVTPNGNSNLTEQKKKTLGNASECVYIERKLGIVLSLFVDLVPLPYLNIHSNSDCHLALVNFQILSILNYITLYSGFILLNSVVI